MAIRNIIFDFDGTLADTSALILATMKQAVNHMQLSPKTDDEYRSTIGLRLEEVPSKLWPEELDLSEKYAETYRRYFEIIKSEVPITLFPDVKETLEKLRESGIRMGVATSRSHKSLEGLIKEFGIIENFDILIGGDDVINGKPNPEPVLNILKEMNWLPEETIVVGDMAVDIYMGKGAGVMTCGVTYGNGSRQELQEAGADIVIDFIKLLRVI